MRNRLDVAVENGIITQAQKDAILALQVERSAHDVGLNMAHILWAMGCALVVAALVLLAWEIGGSNPERYMVIGLVYSAGLLMLDRIVSVDGRMRLLSSMIWVAISLCLMLVIFAWQEATGEPDPLGAWQTPPPPDNPNAPPTRKSAYDILVYGVYLPMLPLACVAFFLVARRLFLPAWVLGCFGLAMMVLGTAAGLGLDDSDTMRNLGFGFGIALVGLGWWFDLRDGANHGFWANKIGLFLIFFAVFILFDDGHMELFAAISLLCILYAVYIRRPSGVSIGAIGIAFYLADWFDGWDDFLVPAMALAVFGLGAIFLGVKARLLEDKLDLLLPDALRQLRPASRDDPVTFGF